MSYTIDGMIQRLQELKSVAKNGGKTIVAVEAYVGGDDEFFIDPVADLQDVGEPFFHINQDTLRCWSVSHNGNNCDEIVVIR